LRGRGRHICPTPAYARKVSHIDVKVVVSKPWARPHRTQEPFRLGRVADINGHVRRVRILNRPPSHVIPFCL
jgi:hypothetical protein